ncbi:MAG: tRNA-binding protein [Firmicutes bacterium]|nr:tRNA-binding protein [Bacillota bacterium]
MSGSASFDDFCRVDMRVGRVVAAAPLAGARRPAYRLEIDFGPEIGRKTASAQLTRLYGTDELVGRQVIGVVNLAPKRIAGVNSEVLVLGLPLADAADVVLLAPEREVPLGGRVF